MRTLRGGKVFKPYDVSECWDSDRTINEWLSEVNTWSDNPVGAFDFPLRERLKSLCDSYGYSLRALADGGVSVKDNPSQAVTFVENHDIARNSPIINDKMMTEELILGFPWTSGHNTMEEANSGHLHEDMSSMYLTNTAQTSP